MAKLYETNQDGLPETHDAEAYRVLLRAYQHDDTPSDSLQGASSVTLYADADTDIIHRGKISPVGEKPCSNAHLFETKKANVSETQFSRKTTDVKHASDFKYILMHNSPLRMRWDITQAFVLLYLAILVPLRIGFNLEVHGYAYIVECMVEIYFYFDIFFNFITSYEDENLVVVRNLRKIADQYIRGWFVVDVVSVLPVDLAIRISEDLYPCSFEEAGCKEAETGPSAAGQYVKLVKMLRLIRLVKLLRLMRLSRLTTKYQDHLFNLLRIMAYVKMIVLIVYLGHIFGCMFYFFSDDEWHTSYEKERMLNGTMSTWLLDYFVPDGSPAEADATLAPLTERYIASAYWAFTTMTTVGYGDISANSVAERTFAILGMIVGGLMLSTIASNIIVLFDEAHMHEKCLKQKMLQVEQWAKDLRLSKPTRVRLLTFYRRQSSKPYSEKELLMQLPFEMRSLIVKHMYASLIDKVPFFKDADMVFRTQLCVGFKGLTLMPRRYIYLQGEHGSDMYMISDGTANVVDWYTNKDVGQLGRGAYFGEGGLVGDIRRRETLKSATMLQLYIVPFDHMKRLLDLYPEVRKKMQAVYEQRVYLYNKRHPITYKHKYLFLAHDDEGEVSAIKYCAPTKTLAEVDTNKSVSYFDQPVETRGISEHEMVMLRMEKLEKMVGSLSEKMDAYFTQATKQ
eukprot:CAMPEP_0198200140 /NCGR_PEP_ID=MMETSP1445-20131203/3190_1 /TAXON_ID=36898 /ORGANISM="Pyramimonas sp., Strain CCMP2087" /LENGTH=680 /DNA_ID=CAMNT_0043870107 /DNA_START=189 /DNA_END=2234 /DNA_ORIENTATION=+